MAGVNLHLRHSVAQLFPAVSSSPLPPPQLGISPSRVLFSNLRANSAAAASSLRTTRRSNTVSAAPVSSSTSSGSLAGDGDEAGRRTPLLEVKDLRAVIVESRQEILKGVNLVVYEGEVTHHSN